MPFHLCKQTRQYHGYPYQGPTSDGAPAVYETVEGAIAAVELFQTKNPVGWNVFNADTKKLVAGVDMFAEASVL